MAKQNKEVDMTNFDEIQKEFMSTQEIKPKQKKTKKQTEPKEVKEKKAFVKPKYIKDAQTMWEHFKNYVQETKSNPFKIKDWVGKDAWEVKREKERPLTMEGFEEYCAENEIIQDLGDYFRNKDNRYSEYATICQRILNSIRRDQIEGGLANIYNPSITQRLNGLTDKQEIKQELTAEIKSNVDYSKLSDATLTDLLNNSQKND